MTGIEQLRDLARNMRHVGYAWAEDLADDLDSRRCREGGVEMMTTDSDRREVARGLRELANGYEEVSDFDLARTLGLGAVSRYGYDPDDVRRLADLIEPSCDRDTPQKVAEEMFGKMRHSMKEEADAYDDMLKSKSVEIYPVDRDALLKLADEMDEVAQRRRSMGYEGFAIGDEDRASRIREACGEVVE